MRERKERIEKKFTGMKAVNILRKKCAPSNGMPGRDLKAAKKGVSH